MGNNNPELHPENLVTPTPEQARINGRKGGKRSQQVQKARKTFKDLFLELGETPFKKSSDPSKGKIYNALKILLPNLDEKDFNHKTALYIGLLKTALSGGKGSVQAFIALRDTMGQKPVDTVVNLNTELEIDDQDKEMLRETAKKYLKIKK